MAHLPRTVFRAFRKLREEFRFVKASALADFGFVSLVSKYDEEVYLYILVHDNRRTGGNVFVDLWIAPPESPDDTLDRLYVGYKVLIADEYEVDDEFFAQCQARIIGFLPCVPAIRDVVVKELRNPPFRSARYDIYLMERDAYRRVVAHCEQGNPAAAELLDAARKTALGRASWSALETVGVRTGQALAKAGVFQDEFLNHFKRKAEIFGGVLSRPAYAYALGELSEAGS